jgi:hypothetical protein
MRKVAIAIAFLAVSTATYAEFIGIADDKFRPHFHAQQSRNWCWASCAEMILSYQGINLPQGSIVQRVKGATIDAPANYTEISTLINSVFIDSSGKLVVTSGQFVPGAPSPNVIYNYLKQGRPIILSYATGPFSNHDVILTGIEANVTFLGVAITKLHVFDPNCYRPNYVSYPWGATYTYLVEDDAIAKKEYGVSTMYNQVMLPVGPITAMYLIDSTKL